MNSLFPPAIEAAFQPYQQEKFAKILVEINADLEKRYASATSLVDMQAKGLLADYLSSISDQSNDFFDYADYRSTTKKQPNAFFDLNVATHAYDDLGALMAYVDGGGHLDDLKHDDWDKVKAESLVGLLAFHSPQQLIAAAGLKPGPTANRLYKSLIEHLLKEHAPTINKDLESRDMTEKAMIFQLFRVINTKATPADFQLPLDEAHCQALTATLNTFEPNAYRTLIEHILTNENDRRWLPAEDTDQESRHETSVIMTSLQNLFFTEAYHFLDSSADTARVFDVLRQKAEVVCALTGFDAEGYDGAVEQLLCCAFSAHPDHFAAAGFGLKNLVGIDPKPSKFRHLEYLPSGPLAIFTHCRIHGFVWLESVMGYLQGLEPGLSPASMIEHQGLNHTRLIPIIKAKKGYIPALEIYVSSHELERDRGSDVAHEILSRNAFSRYSLPVALKLLVCYLQYFPMRQADGSIEASDTNRAKNLNHIFRGAYMQYPAVKDALIAFMETKTGWTHTHLVLTGLDAHSAPNIVKHMHLHDLKHVFTSDLGM